MSKIIIRQSLTFLALHCLVVARQKCHLAKFLVLNSQNLEAGDTQEFIRQAILHLRTLSRDIMSPSQGISQLSGPLDANASPEQSIMR